MYIYIRHTKCFALCFSNKKIIVLVYFGNALAQNKNNLFTKTYPLFWPLINDDVMATLPDACARHLVLVSTC